MTILIENPPISKVFRHTHPTYVRIFSQSLRRNRAQARDTWKGHTDTITGMKLSPDGTMLLSNSMDNTLRVWDTRPYVEGERCTKLLR